MAQTVPALPGTNAERFRELLRAQVRRRAVIRRLAETERPRAFGGRNGDRYTYLVHLDTHPTNAGGWRVTYLIEEKPFPEYQGPAELTPCGHVTGRTYADALREADTLGADLSDEIEIP
jgi:hypothetical protein